MRPLGTLMSELSGEDDPDCERRCFKMFCPGYHEISLANKQKDILGYLRQPVFWSNPSFGGGESDIS